MSRAREEKVQAANRGHPNPKRLGRKGEASKTDYKVTTEVGRKPEGYLEAMVTKDIQEEDDQLCQMLLTGTAR